MDVSSCVIYHGAVSGIMEYCNDMNAPNACRTEEKNEEEDKIMLKFREKYTFYFGNKRYRTSMGSIH